MIVFRAGVGAIIINPEGKVMAFQRSDNHGAWQLPQGGLHEGEEYLEGMFREVYEETGIRRDHLELLSEYPEWLAYELPKDIWSRKNFRGQVHKWFLLRFTGDEREIDLDKAKDDEFKAWRWMSFAKLTEKTLPFKKDIYRKLAQGFSEYLAD